MGFQITYGFEEELFLIGRRWLSYFSEHTGQTEYIRVQSKTPIKLNRNKKPSNRIIQKKKSGAEKTSTNTFGSGISEEKINKRFTGESWNQFEFEPCYNCEKTSQLSYKSRVLHSIMVVRACGGIFERGGSRNSHYFAYFYTYVDKNMLLEMDITLVFLSGF